MEKNDTTAFWITSFLPVLYTQTAFYYPTDQFCCTCWATLRTPVTPCKVLLDFPPFLLSLPVKRMSSISLRHLVLPPARESQGWSSREQFWPANRYNTFIALLWGAEGHVQLLPCAQVGGKLPGTQAAAFSSIQTWWQKPPLPQIQEVCWVWSVFSTLVSSLDFEASFIAF